MNISFKRFLPHFVCALFLSVILVEPAFAQSLGPAEDLLETIVGTLKGGIARSLGALALIVMGFALIFGKIDLRQFGYFIAGMVLIFGSAEIVTLLAGK